MATVNLNPAFTSAKGSLGKIVLYNRRGVQCARTRVIPRNPDTVKQRANRRTFADAVSSWQELSPEEKYRYNRKAFRMRMSGYNLFISRYMKEYNLYIKTVSGFQVKSFELNHYNPLRLPFVSHSIHPVSREYPGYLLPAGLYRNRKTE